MAHKKRGASEWERIDVAIEGKVKPAEIGIRHLAELLEATAAVVESVARDAECDAPAVSLIRVRGGSAHYVMNAGRDDRVVRHFYHTLKTNGRDASPRTRRALSRLNGAGRVGSVRVTPFTADDARAADPVHVAPISEDDADAVELGDEVYGRVVGVLAGRDRMTVRIRLDDGATDEYDANDDVAERAATLFNRKVRASVHYTRKHDQLHAIGMDSIEAWEEEDFFAAIDHVADRLARSGLKIDVDRLLAEDD